MATRRVTGKDAVLKVRVESKVLERWRAVAGEQGLSAWARRVLGEEAGEADRRDRDEPRWWEVAQDAKRRLKQLKPSGPAPAARRRAAGLRELARVAQQAAELLERYGHTRRL